MTPAQAEEQRMKNTFLSHTHTDELGGRFEAVETHTIIGNTPTPNNYPAGAPWVSEKATR
jgi:hypothetical protein